MRITELKAIWRNPDTDLFDDQFILSVDLDDISSFNKIDCDFDEELTVIRLRDGNAFNIIMPYQKFKLLMNTVSINQTVKNLTITNKN